MSGRLSVGIVGGGIGGLTVANALARRGVRVRVYEQASHYYPAAGAGFGFSPNGQVCLASIGVDTKPMLHRFDTMVHLNREGTKTLESDLFRRMRDRYGFGLCGCLRADLVGTLSRALADIDGDILRYSHKLVATEQDDKAVRLEFDNGAEAEHDLLVGADGIHSKVAELLDIDHSPPVFSNANIYYGVIEDPDSVDFGNDLLRRDNTVIQGNCIGQFVTFRAGPEGEKKVHIWAATYPAAEPPAREEWGVAADPASSPELASILNQFPTNHMVHELAARTTPGRLLHFGLFSRKHKDVWSRGRTCLLGDSVHATLPYVGQGANQAIEDAIVLADCLLSEEHSNNHELAFRAYHEKRSRRTKRVVQMANYMNYLHHTQNPILATLRDILFASFLKGNVMFKVIEKEIVEECPIPVEDFAKYQ